MTTIESHRWVTHCASYISCAKKIQDSFSIARLHAGRQAVSFASLRRSSIGSELFEFCAFLGGIFFRSRVVTSCSRVSCFLCRSGAVPPSMARGAPRWRFSRRFRRLFSIPGLHNPHAHQHVAHEGSGLQLRPVYTPKSCIQ